MLALFVSACSPEPVTGSGERGLDVAELTPVPTASIAEINPEPTIEVEPTPEPEGPAPFVIATVMGETGVMRPLDAPAVAGVIAEVERLNEAGGVLGRPLELRRFDTNSRTSLAERFAVRLAEEPPDLIITSCDTEFSEPVLEMADEAGIITMSPCADDARYLTGALGSRNFTLGAPAEPRGALAARVAVERYGQTAIVLRDMTSPEALGFCDGFERAFRELGGTVVYRDEFRYDTLEPVQDRLAERGRASDFITLCSHVPGEIDAAPSIILILRTLGFQAPILAGSSVDEPGWFASVPTLGELTYVSWSSTFGNDPDERINEIIRVAQRNADDDADTEDLGGELPAPPPGISTILGAESVEAWARAVEAARDGSPDRISAALASFSSEIFATGDVSFVSGARMDVGRLYRVLQVVDGELSVIALEATEN